jgi:hypothetical protein
MKDGGILEKVTVLALQKDTRRPSMEHFVAFFRLFLLFWKALMKLNASPTALTKHRFPIENRLPAIVL